MDKESECKHNHPQGNSYDAETETRYDSFLERDGGQGYGVTVPVDRARAGRKHDEQSYLGRTTTT